MMASRIPNHTTAGLTMVELMFVMAILSGMFVAACSTMIFIGAGMQSEAIYSDQYARSSGTLYDLVAELREAAVYSPNFYVEVDPAKAPLITFDKIDGVDSSGNTVWGKKITYRLERVTGAAAEAFEAAHSGILVGRLMREESTPNNTDPPLLMVIEENVPFKFAVNGVVTWGFNVTRDGCALSISISRFGDQHLDAGAQSAQNSESKTASKVTAAPPNSFGLSTVTQGSIVIATARGVYFLKNPQVVIPAQ